MKLIFVCPEADIDFTSDRFKVIQNKGVKTDAKGNKSLDAKVELDEPCPVCGKRHVYRANELACPFE